MSTRLEPRKRARPVFSKTKNQMNKRSQRNQGRYLAGIKGSRLERPPKKDKGRCGKAKCAKNGRVVCYTLLYFGPNITKYNKKQYQRNERSQGRYWTGTKEPGWSDPKKTKPRFKGLWERLGVGRCPRIGDQPGLVHKQKQNVKQSARHIPLVNRLLQRNSNSHINPISNMPFF